MDVFECIKARRSIRRFKNNKVSKENILKVLECGRWAPSGLNHQPWKVIVVSDDELKQKLADCTHYKKIIVDAPHLFVILLDRTNSYSYVKNVQSIGAFFQNLLLGLHDLGLGGVWLGEIYNQKEKVHNVLNIKNIDWEFMGAIAFGHPNEKSSSNRREIEDFTEWR